jgi:hypothetical protein
MNPLHIPWGQKPKEVKDERDPVPIFLGVRNEAVRDSAHAEKCITVVVRGLKGATDGEYRLEWTEGTPLKQYLSRLKLVSVAARAAVRDTTNLEVGRLRLHYIPKEGAKITLGSPSVSSALQYQRSSHDAGEVASRMGGGSKFVDLPLTKR